ncbi:type II secretion system F family protein [Pseudomethylobacillus aquaticus]|uniref:Type II secretion system F family protein n=1 Tax=Pseudomethylobacillus aquaticus TaxID=2676064 RepID=A0A3N0V6B6_9PROT|nr:type II secretion system F family protein [Pseudomethylobacillus aquaticus]ROH88134.1 type II secretion system F family protein [Pseudomethylobacillus aquaticus]
MNPLLWGVSICVLCALALLVLDRAAHKSRQVSQRFEDVFRRNVDDSFHLNPSRWPMSLDWMLNKLEVSASSKDDEIGHLLMQAGWGSERIRFIFRSALLLLPPVMALLAWLLLVPTGSSLLTQSSYPLLGFAAAYLGLKRLLVVRARTRLKAIRSELVPLLHMLRMLFDSGLSLEHALRVCAEEGTDLVPNMAQELQKVIARIMAGQDRGEALSKMAEAIALDELSDTVAMLRQVTQYGGNVRDSLANYTTMMQERQMSDLREYVSKLSAKMTMVMVIFMFPALLLLIAGPGFMSLVKALGTI